MGDIVLGTPGKTVLSESSGTVSWGTGAPTGTMIQIVDNPITSVITRGSGNSFGAFSTPFNVTISNFTLFFLSL